MQKQIVYTITQDSDNQIFSPALSTTETGLTPSFYSLPKIWSYTSVAEKGSKIVLHMLDYLNAAGGPIAVGNKVQDLSFTDTFTNTPYTILWYNAITANVYL